MSQEVETSGTISKAQLSIVLAMAALAAGCSSAPSLKPSLAQPTYLGAAPAAAEPYEREMPAGEPRVSAGKVLSAIVFQRVTGLEVDPARLVER